MGHHPPKQADRVMRGTGIRVRGGTIGGAVARGSRNGMPPTMRYPAFRDSEQPEPSTLAALNRARLAARCRAELERTLWVQLAAAQLPTADQRRVVDAVLLAADRYAAVAVNCAGSYPPHEVIAAASSGRWSPCHCLCTSAHPAVGGVCEPLSASTTRRMGGLDVPVCPPCWAAQHEQEARECQP